MRLIDADLMAVDESEAYMSAQTKITDTATKLVNEVVHKKIQMLLADTPEVDAVPVVRCEDCKLWHAPLCPMDTSESWTAYDEFCSRGKRKEGSK